jgi:hypothetical protein
MKWNNKTGSSVIEVIFVIVAFFVFVFGIIGPGLYKFRKNMAIQNQMVLNYPRDSQVQVTIGEMGGICIVRDYDVKTRSLKIEKISKGYPIEFIYVATNFVKPIKIECD